MKSIVVRLSARTDRALIDDENKESKLCSTYQTARNLDAVVAAVHEIKKNEPQSPAKERHTVIVPVGAADESFDSAPKNTNVATILVGDLLGLPEVLLHRALPGLVGVVVLVDPLLEAEILLDGHALYLFLGGVVGDRDKVAATAFIGRTAGLARGVAITAASTLISNVSHLDLAAEGERRCVNGSSDTGGGLKKNAANQKMKEYDGKSHHGHFQPRNQAKMETVY